MKKIYNMLLLAVLTMTMFSCSNWDSPYYIDDIVGSWVSYYGQDAYGEYDILGADQVRFDFYSNYTGRYTYYSYYGLDYVDFDWDTRGDRLIIHYYDGTSEYLFYGFDRNGDLLLATDSRFYNYTAYYPAGGGFYYEPAKEMNGTGVQKAAPKVDTDKATAPTGPRATKSRDALKEKN